MRMRQGKWGEQTPAGKMWGEQAPVKSWGDGGGGSREVF